RRRDDDAAELGRTVRVPARLLALDDPAGADHPVTLAAAAAEAPAPGDEVAAVDRHRLPGDGPDRPGKDDVGSVTEDLAHALVGQAERCRAGDRVGPQIPADRAIPLRG